jgi:UDP-glucose 4-epimerase
MKNILVITGGAGFVGTNLISLLVKKTKFNIISIDNYSSGSKKNHIKNKKIKYINSDTKNISKILNPYKKNINSLFHFGLSKHPMVTNLWRLGQQRNRFEDNF